ncbi:translation initiation factor IF-2 [Ichthyobacterium seriolicida]|uniref:Translation initiation factor IF-2 n=1 Tax=Ichthyobacterium seriolicida TaxID=242600 RepID=A0A1J1E270_9FLAO|nr:translation initiation factor IF-2 [Ichthyobacterium seriolicida]BAV95053.1 translation initiation factor IF-2 [Ichthyobacterium seriolicida]
MSKNKIRVSKITKELNISLHRLVEFLRSKGIEVEKSPNTRIDESAYGILLKEFREDRDKKIISEEIGEESRREKQALKEEEIAIIEAKKEERESKVITTQRHILKAPKVLKTLSEDKLYNKKPISTKISEDTPLKQEQEVEGVIDTIENDKETNVIQIEQADKKEELKNNGGVEKLGTKYQKLTGPVITGQKIDLTSIEEGENRKKKEKEKRAEDNKKRKRIVKKPSLDSYKKDFSKEKKSKVDKGVSAKNLKLEEENTKKKIRETLDKLTSKRTSKFKGVKYRKEKRELRKEIEIANLEKEERDKTILKLTEYVTVSELAGMMNIPVNNVISTCMMLGIMVTVNQRLDEETLTIVAEEFNYTVEFITGDIQEVVEQQEDDEKDLIPRSPIVTVMGHVDHGKTSLLDYIRKDNVTSGEAGGITQHIGAYSVKLRDEKSITFLDTPGHEAFTAMRAHGTQLTDIVIIVIAADDSIMPQTKESISHAKVAGVPIIFAINKVDKENSNPDKIKEQLASMDLLVEDWGGKIQSQNISAKVGTGVKDLLEKVLLEAEMLELRANPNRDAYGTVIESSLDKGKGYVTNVLVQNGTLKVGDYILAGKYSGKVKSLQNERGSMLKQAVPSTPVSILGLDGAPQSGDKFSVFKDEREAKQIAMKRMQLQREQLVRTNKRITLDEIGRRIAVGDFKELNVILKSDVVGSAEALSDSIQKLSTTEIHVNIIHKGVGHITESDVLLASASDAVIIGFQVRPSAKSRQLADREKIEIRTYSIIYDAIDDIRSAMEGMLSPVTEEEIVCNVEIRELFKVSKIGTVAGCMVLDGKISIDANVRIIRDNVVVHTGKLGALKRFKDDVKEVAKGYECGLNILNYNDIRVGDIIEGYKEVEVQKKL